jgi:transmembrane sensor
MIMRRKINTDQIADLIQKYQNNNNKKMIDKYIGSDEKSRKEFDTFLDVWEKSADLKDYEKIDAADDWQKVRFRMNLKSEHKIIPLRSYMVRIAAVLILAAGLGYFLTRVMKNVSEGKSVYMEVAAGQSIKNVELPDGTVITLNKGAKIIRNNDFARSNRDIILEGEAFFKVARNEALPFKVHTLNSTVEVLGTSFEIRSDSVMVVVGVLSGKVAFYASNDQRNRIELAADKTGFFNSVEQKITFSNTFDPNTIAWHTHQFVFRDMPLDKVGQILADYYDLQLVTGENVESVESVTLTCSTESLDEVLFSVNNSLVGDIKLLNANNYLIVRKQ